MSQNFKWYRDNHFKLLQNDHIMLDKSLFSPDTHHFLRPEALKVLAEIISNNDASTKIKINNKTENQADRGYDANRMQIAFSSDLFDLSNSIHVEIFEYLSSIERDVRKAVEAEGLFQASNMALLLSTPGGGYQACHTDFATTKNITKFKNIVHAIPYIILWPVTERYLFPLIPILLLYIYYPYYALKHI